MGHLEGALTPLGAIERGRAGQKTTHQAGNRGELLSKVLPRDKVLQRNGEQVGAYFDSWFATATLRNKREEIFRL
jgi:hypothetical protein